MIDLHCHLLPGVDDGPAEMEIALEMCRLAARDGTTAAFATPHVRHERWWNGDRAELEAVWRELTRAAPDGFEIYLGAEIAVRSHLLEEVAQLPGGDLLTLGGSRYLLLELHPRGLGPDPGELIHELVVDGFWPIIAHPERVGWLMADLPLVEHLVAEGAYLQLTAMSLTGEMGRFAEANAHELLNRGLVHFLSSDAHDLHIRPPGLRRAFERVRETHGEDLARALVYDHPKAVVEDRSLESVAVDLAQPVHHGP